MLRSVLRWLRHFTAKPHYAKNAYTKALGAHVLRYITFIFLLFCSSLSYSDEWRWEVYHGNDDSAGIFASREGFRTLEEAVKSISKSTWIKFVRVPSLQDLSSFQEELHSYMSENYPDELKEALQSAGNMHNPKIVRLRNAFEEAILNSEYVKNINLEFRSRCEKISSASFEKFTIIKKETTPTYWALLWLTTEKCT